MILLKTTRLTLVWSWPSGPMVWFMWARRSTIWRDTRWYRIGPLTLDVRDKNLQTEF
jgi:hypothetical protein